ncbi:spore germination protein [Thermoflavimicrobium dichotomicum]|uniref:Spore germination protein KA n=1 Tax=Thermoflavimicrobium dichotomicum TaxID=46223 RepID=A0A1I3TJZ6_9BACL|nr:spore germination protein [Thermoflavimicrobium dichotomicum]SFJ70940.1 spore germination protein KA [Thermoflavimicrobium dichotomicum]
MSIFRRNRKWLDQSRQQNIPQKQAKEGLSFDLNSNVQTLQSIYRDCSDVVFHHFNMMGNTRAVLVYIDGLTNIEEVNQHVLAPLISENHHEQVISIDTMREKIPVSQIVEVDKVIEAVEAIANGNPVLLMDGQRQAIIFGLGKWEQRNIEEPTAESVIRGSREGFIESLRVNTSLLRRRIKSPALKMKSLGIGHYTRTEVAIAYIEGLANPDLVEEVTQRVQRIEIDGVLETGYIEEMIEDNPYSPFPQLLATERPDVAAASLLEGRVVILVDGTSFVLVAPITFFVLLQAPEDYYGRYMIGSSIRWLRFLFLVIALLGPSAYVAVLSYHQEMIPTTLLLTIAQSRERIPFPALIEALILEITFEALREAGVRLPKQVGAAISIVGALVIGQAATAAGLASSPLVMVVAITGIASFLLPRYTTGIAIRMLRFPIMILSGILGLLGMMLGVIALVIHLCTLRSFGVPYLSPIAPLKTRELKDVLYRAPWWKMDTRPDPANKGSIFRQSPGQKPNPIKGDEQ